MHSVKIIKDSISPDKLRITTFELTLPRIVLAEFNTHRVFSRNSASSRAIPVEKMLKRVDENPYVPETWGKNQRGMQADENIHGVDAELAKGEWVGARNDVVKRVKQLLEIGIHKQITNRLLEPFLWHTIVLTTTEVSNYFHLRNNPMAHPAIQTTAGMMEEQYKDSKPTLVKYGDWHLPYVFDEDWDAVRKHLSLKVKGEAIGHGTLMPHMVKVSTARSARVSYLTHDGKREIGKDLELYGRLLGPGHMSPTEHPARPMYTSELNDYGAWEGVLDNGKVFRYPGTKGKKESVIHSLKYLYGAEPLHMRWGAFCGNFNGWVQHRKLIPGEEDILQFKGQTAS